MELSARPEAVDELQAASAVGQGTLFRAYEERLAARDVHAAQVLLTSFDMSARMHYLNARQTLRRLMEWRAVPVVNENDTTATDEITFGDNDFLSAQVAILLGARLLVLLTDTAGLHTADPALDPSAELVRGGRRLRRARGLRDRPAHLGVRLGRDAQQGCRRRDGERGRDPGRDLRRDRARHAGRSGGGGSGRNPLRRPSRAHPLVQALAALREAQPRPARRRRRRRPRAARAGIEPAAGRGHRRRGRRSPRETRSRWSATPTWSARGSPTTRRPRSTGSRACAPSAVLERDAERLRGGDPPRPLRA